jgi:hypothetical protein
MISQVSGGAPPTNRLARRRSQLVSARSSVFVDSNKLWSASREPTLQAETFRGIRSQYPIHAHMSAEIEV